MSFRASVLQSAADSNPSDCRRQSHLEYTRVEESTHFVDIGSKIGAKILRLRFAPLRMTPYFSASKNRKQQFVLQKTPDVLRPAVGVIALF